MIAPLLPEPSRIPPTAPGRPATAERFLRVTHAGEHASLDRRPRTACMSVVSPSMVESQPVHRDTVMDVDAYNRAVEAHSDALLRYVVKHLRDRDEAKDIVQDAFLRLWMRLDKVSVTGARSYLFTTAHNLIVDRSRRRKNLTRYDAWHEDVQTTQQPKAGLKDIINAALDKLTPVQRKLILLRDLEGHSYEDITEITGLDMTKVKVYLYRARKAMQAHLGDLAEVI